MTTVLLAIGFFAVFFIFMSVRLLFIKNGEFKGTCASQSPFLNKDGGPCSYCGKDASQCEKRKDNIVEELISEKA
ncbi:hypothetical protein R9C00_21005 [Flammeovirgaceae bacterium SG7u.111]|nr:hypothetical protein [Flammeovirgaceae bacterium SG7u.132]WPO34181.1 hypothetical protein R9C00_21005 [Flammeovirgaceae bacterium SG7u.111]